MSDIIDIPDDEHGPYDPAAIRNLVIAIMEQGVEDAVKGEPSAIAWMKSRSFDHYCTWLEIDPTAARQGIREQMRGANCRYKEADLQRVVDLHSRGVAWHIGMRQVFGYYSETLRTVIKRYAAAGTV